MRRITAFNLGSLWKALSALPFYGWAFMGIAMALEEEWVLPFAAFLLVFMMGGVHFLAWRDWRVLEVRVIGKLLVVLACFAGAGLGAAILLTVKELFEGPGVAVCVGLLPVLMTAWLYSPREESRVLATAYALGLAFIGSIFCGVAIGVAVHEKGTPLAAIEEFDTTASRGAALFMALAMPLGLVAAFLRARAHHLRLPAHLRESMATQARDEAKEEMWYKLPLTIISIAAAIFGWKGVESAGKAVDLLIEILK